MDAVNAEAMELLARRPVPAGLALTEAERENTGRIRALGLVVLQLIAQGYSIASVSQIRSESLAELITSMRDTLDALGVETIRDGIREAQRRGLIL
jgi:hypothetical protein